MSLQEVSVELIKIAARDKRAADVFWWIFDGLPPSHSTICALCNLSLLDVAGCRSLFRRRLLKHRQPRDEFFIERVSAVKT